MKEITRFCEYIKNDFSNNRAKFAVLFLAIVLWGIGFANPNAEQSVKLFSDICFSVLLLICIFALFSFFDIMGFVKRHSTATLVFWVAYFIAIAVYKKAKPDYPVENDMMLLAVMIYGTIPYRTKNCKTYGTILGATIAAVCIAILALQKLWWAVSAFECVAIYMQILVAFLDVYGGKPVARIIEAFLLNALLIWAALFLVCGKTPHIPGAFEPFSKTELTALVLLCVFLVFAAIAVLKYKDRNYYALCTLIALATQIFLFAFSRTNPELSGYLGLPFAESDVLNRSGVMPLAVGIILSAPTIDNPMTLKRFFNKE